MWWTFALSYTGCWEETDQDKLSGENRATTDSSKMRTTCAIRLIRKPRAENPTVPDRSWRSTGLSPID
jgi:hypothetical protein